MLDAGGDVFKFAGDALLAFWSYEAGQAFSALDIVLKMSLQLQHVLACYVTCEISLPLKIAVSTGFLDIYHFKSTSCASRQYMATGPAISRVRDLQSFAVAGQIVICSYSRQILGTQYAVLPSTAHPDVFIISHRKRAFVKGSRSFSDRVDAAVANPSKSWFKWIKNSWQRKNKIDPVEPRRMGKVVFAFLLPFLLV